MKKTDDMGTVSFPSFQRFEMAVAWAFPISVAALLLLPFWPEGVLPIAAFVWAWALLIFLSFPLYEKSLRTSEKSVGFVFFDFGKRGLPILGWVVLMLGLVVYTVFVGNFSWPLILRWGLSSLVIVMILGLDLSGSTPVYKSGLHPDRLLHIVLDAQKCKGAGFCEQVCPVDVFDVDYERRMASLPRAEQCVQCGACIVQCPFDALYFQDPNGDVIAPDTVRKFKLNLIGNRKVEARPTP